ncbi:hypothetical protein [Leptospira alstonii]|uniref:Uncharacterized protein n=2 Tax=Leptospira alstonii TaxID=28452 RepID=M6D1P7_9LEPT|nr:hypothetical protein [Leptospira alstonii]EMJ98062.1 hypothetical protein LEP1GSC194_2501 [Leptospira alstonii serovar Sichuan str. 79601]EQA81118.1 hypothetical protein LEP1GSC193_2463 [Leptospira alstonii serovar Pingchang str. 80-412]
MKENQQTPQKKIGSAICVLFFLWNVSLFSQNESKDSKEKEKVQSDRELIETGKLESIRKKAFLGLKGIRISLLNFGKKQDLDKLAADYGQAETLYLKAEYGNATTAFENIFKTILPLEETIRKDYENRTIQLAQELAPMIVSIRLDEKNKNRSILPVLEKYYVRSGETSKAATKELEKGERTSALYYQRQSLLSLYHIKILLGKNEDSKLSLSDKISKNKILDSDYLKPEELIYWDDAEGRLNAEEERKKDRTKTLKSYELKLGIFSGKPQKESETKSQNSAQNPPKTNTTKP